ncbi:MAG: glycoside hydrolase family 2 TIM barrel-domain containing protein [Ilumatobacteraceae bacterium]
MDSTLRQSKALEAGWYFAPDLDAPAVIPVSDFNPPENGWRAIRVPGYWQLQFPDLARSTGVGWYRVEFSLDHVWLASESLTIELGAASYFCQGWLNDQYLGSNEGGLLSFSWSLGAAARSGTNELYVRVVSPSGDRSRYREFPFEETLHGKQSWYGPTGGLWQEVSVHARSALAIERLDIQPNVSDCRVQVRAELSGRSTHRDECIEYRIIAPDGAEVAVATSAPGEALDVDLGDHRPQLWSPDSPSLYFVLAKVIVDGVAFDIVEKRFGFRTFERVDGRFVLNGEPILLRGVLDQDYWDSPGVPASKDEIAERFSAVKSMGFNTIRCHIKLPDPRYLDVADELGMLLWCELPTTSRLTTAARGRIEDALSAMIARDRHHPSVVVWGIANEAWGFDLVGSAEHRAWLNQLYHRAKKDAPDRLIVDNSPCAPNFHVETDIEDYHFYAVIPEMRERWDQFLEAFTGRADFTFSPHGDARRTGTEPLVVSEFGAWGLPDLSDLIDEDGREPWWFESGQEWADGAAYVHGFVQRYELWHLDKVFGSWRGLCEETQRRQFETLQHQIETMRARPEIAGYVLTELSDVFWEANGLLDMAGRPRGFADRVASLNQSPMVMTKVDRTAVWDGDTVGVGVSAVNDGLDRPESQLRCGLVETGEFGSSEERPLAPFGHHPTVGFDVTATCDERPRLTSIECSLVSDGARAATADQPLLVVPRTGPQVHPDRAISVSDDSLARRLRELGYVVTDTDADLRVLRRLGPDDHDFIEAGGKALLMADDTQAFGDGFGEYPKIELKAWHDALFGGGEWVSAFSWLRRVERFADLPGGPMMDSFFEGLTPSVVITGVPPARYEHDVLAGVFVGWVHQVAALVIRHHAGLGSVLVSTLRLTERGVGEDPLADWLLHHLIATAWEQH